MRTLMIGIALVLLLLISLSVGMLAADWPFWQRALVWERQSWPASLPGAHIRIDGARAGGIDFMPVAASGSGELQLLQGLRALPAADALLVARGNRLLLERYAPGVDASSLLASRELASVLPALLYGVALGEGRVASPDAPVAAYLNEWREEPRGSITARQLMWNLSGLESPPFVPWNPLHRRGRLASGPDFARAALSFYASYPAGSHFELSPANPQLVGLLLERATGVPFAQALQQRLWQPLGAAPAIALADRSAGRMALHCCFNATARDWLRLGVLLANDGVVPNPGGARLLPEGWVAQMATASPVHPGFGLAMAVERTAAGAQLLHLTGTGRDIWIAPAERVVVVRFEDRNEAKSGSDTALFKALAGALRTM
jgi:Beta-lactamase